MSYASILTVSVEASRNVKVGICGNDPKSVPKNAAVDDAWWGEFLIAASSKTRFSQPDVPSRDRLACTLLHRRHRFVAGVAALTAVLSKRQFSETGSSARPTSTRLDSTRLGFAWLCIPAFSPRSREVVKYLIM